MKKKIGTICAAVLPMVFYAVRAFAYTVAVEPPKRSILPALCVILAVLLFLVMSGGIWWMHRLREAMRRGRIRDVETGIGNLAFFDECFRQIPYEQRAKYTLLYIIIDSNYLQIYHGELAMSDAVKYTAGILSEFADENAIVARITENGFILAFCADDGPEVVNKVEVVREKLDMFLSDSRAEDSPYFYAAVYTMRIEDKNCEYLLYNLRRNCNIHTNRDHPLVYCDVQMMNSEVEEKRLIERIENGFDRKEFKMYMQFIVDRETEQIVSAEALSRWVDSEGNVISPAVYIGALEKAGRISRLDYYMFEKVCCQLHKWRDTEFENLSLSCNFTRITISESDFMTHIREIASRYVFDKEKLIIEITEDAIEKNYNRALENILQCRQMGFKIALDDMGSGYTSLVNLCEYPISEVKLDRGILLKAEKTGMDLLYGIIALVHNMGIQVVCEGVETEAQRELIAKTNCEYIQGWYYSKPISEREAARFVRDYRAKQAQQ